MKKILSIAILLAIVLCVSINYLNCGPSENVNSLNQDADESLSEFLGKDSKTADQKAAASPSLSDVILAVGGEQTCAIAKVAQCTPNIQKKIYCWGANTYGGLGIGTFTPSNEPKSVSVPGTPVSIVSGMSHTCAIVSDFNSGTNKLYCWGRNQHGQVGNGTTNINGQTTPVLVNLSGTPKSMALGLDSTCAIVAPSSGPDKLYCWGSNNNSALGIGNSVNTDYTSPQLVSFPSSATPKQIQAGEAHYCAIANSSSDKMYCWGDGIANQLGNGFPPLPPYPGNDKNSPTEATLPNLAIPLSLSLGGSYSCAMGNDNGNTKEYCWGHNGYGVLGNGLPNTNVFSAATVYTTPQAVTTLPGAPTQIDSGFRHTCSILNVAGTSKVYCWGENVHGQLGNNGVTNANTPQATLIASNEQPLQIQSGYMHSCALVQTVSEGQQINCWGDNSWGQLGTKNNTNYNTPQRVQFPGVQPKIAWLESGMDRSCAVVSGKIKCWGNNQFGQLGNGTLTSSLSPVLVSGINNAVAVSNGWSHSCALLNNGEIKCWGLNSMGNLGNGVMASGSVTTPVSVNGINNAIFLSSASDMYNCAVLNNGQIKCWGSNYLGQLGNGTLTASSLPVLVNGINNAVSVSTGIGNPSACAILSTGRVKCWGSNASGQLGNGNQIDSSTPVLVNGITNAISVATSYQTACAVLSTGQIQCWGDNSAGQLGNGSSATFSLTPVTVSGITNANFIANSEGAKFCATLTNGQIKCWGYNVSGQLGNGSNITSNVPTTVLNISTASNVSGRGHSGCAIVNSCGQAQCWGENDYGQLGDGTTTDSWVPVLVNGL